MNKVIYICHKDAEGVKQHSQPKWEALNGDYAVDVYDDARCEHFLHTLL